jgi:ketosteroid isomerase-like protein
MTAIDDLDDFAALDPFFRIIEEGLSGLADGDHFFDLLADDVVFDYVITVPGYPRHVVGRSAVAELYRPYGDTFVLDRCFDLAIHHDREVRCGRSRVRLRGSCRRHRGCLRKPATSRCSRSIDRKVTRWRDYLDPIAVFEPAA